MKSNIINSSLKIIRDNLTYQKINANSINNFENKQCKYLLNFLNDRNYNLYFNHLPPIIIKEKDNPDFFLIDYNEYLTKHQYFRIISNCVNKLDLLFFISFELKEFGLLNIINIAELFNYFISAFELTELQTERFKQMQIEYLQFLQQKVNLENINFLKELNNEIFETRRLLIQTECYSKDIIQLLWLFKKNISDKAMSFFLNLFKTYQFSLNNKRKILEYSFDILKRDNINFSDFTLQLQQFLNALHKSSNIADAVISYLYELRYPTLSRHLKELDNCFKKYSNSKNIKFFYDRNLEDNKIYCMFDINEYSKLKEIIDNFYSVSAKAQLPKDL